MRGKKSVFEAEAKMKGFEKKRSKRTAHRLEGSSVERGEEGRSRSEAKSR